MKITRIEILKKDGTDKVLLYTDLPSALPKLTKVGCTLDFDAEVDTGEAFVKTNFPDIPVKVTDIRPQRKMKFSGH